MHEPRVPVEDHVASLAQRVFAVLVLLPTVLAIVLGFVATIVVRLSGRTMGMSFYGTLSWVVIIGGIQFIIVMIGRWHLIGGAKLLPEAPNRPPSAEPGIFRHES